MAINVSELVSQARGKNPTITADSSSFKKIFDQGNAATIASAQSSQDSAAAVQKEQEEAFAARQAAARVALDTVLKQKQALNTELEALNIRTAQTVQAKAALQGQREVKAQEVAAAAAEVNNSSFFKNPIQWFSSRAKLADTKGDLERSADALISINDVIDEEYATAARNFKTFQTSKVMIAQTEAEFNAKALADKEQQDVIYAAQKAQADEKSLQILATQMKVNPLALEEAKLKLQAEFEEKQEKKKKERDIYGVDALMAAYNLDVTNPANRAQAAASLQLMDEKERQKWNSVQLAIVKRGGKVDAKAVMEEFKVREDGEGYLRTLQAADPELHQEIYRSIQDFALNSPEAKERKAVLLQELRDSNTKKDPGKQLTASQLESTANNTLMQGVLNGDIKSILDAGTYSVRTKIETIASRMPTELVDGKAIGVWAEQIPELSPLVKESLKSPNVVLAYDTGFVREDAKEILDPQASRALAGMEKLIAMGVPETEAAQAYSTILKKATEGYIRTAPGGAKYMDRFSSLGIPLPISNKVPTIQMDYSFFSGVDFTANQTEKLDLFNPTELLNLLARYKAEAKKAEDYTNTILDVSSPTNSILY